MYPCSSYEIIEFVRGASTLYWPSMYDYVCLFLEVPLLGRLRIDDGDLWNANDPHV